MNDYKNVEKKSQRKVMRRYNYVAFEGEFNIGYKGKSLSQRFSFELKNYYVDATYKVYITPYGHMVVVDKDAYVKNRLCEIISDKVCSKKWSNKKN